MCASSKTAKLTIEASPALLGGINMGSTLIEFSDELAEITQSLAPYIVSVRGRRHYPSSGLLWQQGVIVTANHTIHRDEDISVTLADGTTAPASLVGRDPGRDLAVLKVASQAASLASRPASDVVKAGELALVLGRSPDSGINASLEIVSAVSGAWRTWRGAELEAYVRLDARLFPQSSGGAVVNARGAIVGLATSALSRIAGLVIPIATVRRVTATLLEKGFVPRGYIGIAAQTVPFTKELREKFKVSNESGVIILTVEPGGPADKAGIFIGDILVSAGDTLVERVENIQEFSESAGIGKSANLKFIRGGVLKEASVIVGERPGKRS
jgi:S1-C subfamily serine protease